MRWGKRAPHVGRQKRDENEDDAQTHYCGSNGRDLSACDDPGLNSAAGVPLLVTRQKKWAKHRLPMRPLQLLWGLW